VSDVYFPFSPLNHFSIRLQHPLALTLIFNLYSVQVLVSRNGSQLKTDLGPTSFGEETKLHQRKCWRRTSLFTIYSCTCWAKVKKLLVV